MKNIEEIEKEELAIAQALKELNRTLRKHYGARTKADWTADDEHGFLLVDKNRLPKKARDIIGGTRAVRTPEELISQIEFCNIRLLDAALKARQSKSKPVEQPTAPEQEPLAEQTQEQYYHELDKAYYASDEHKKIEQELLAINKTLRKHYGARKKLQYMPDPECQKDQTLYLDSLNPKAKSAICTYFNFDADCMRFKGRLMSRILAGLTEYLRHQTIFA